MKEKFREKLRRRYLNFRSIARLVETREFGRTYDGATDAQRQELDKLIADTDITLIDVREWMADANKRPLESLSWRKLRELARNANVWNYSRLSKDELISALEQADARLMEKRPKAD